MTKRKKTWLPLVIMLASTLGTVAQNKENYAGQKEEATRDVNNLFKEKTPNQLLPRVIVELNYRQGLGENMTGDNQYFKNAYKDVEIASGMNQLGSINYEIKKSTSFDIHFGYFFDYGKHFGVSIGLMHNEQYGQVSLDQFKAQYVDTDAHGYIYRQVVTATKANSKLTSAFTENISLVTMNVPVLFRYKNQFKNQRLGVFLDGGPMFSVSSENHYNTNAQFDYEAIYQYTTAGIATIDRNDLTSLAINDIMYTRSFITNMYKENAVDIVNKFNDLRARGYNVGLDMPVNHSYGAQKYNNFSLGAMVQGGVSYQLTYRITANAGAWYTYQQWANSDNSKYRLTQKVGSYTSLLEGTKNAVNTNWGVMLGIRFFIGPDKDIDDDGVPDRRDDCIRNAGPKGDFHGCPDSDGDGILDKDDACPLERGPACTNGCPDRDGDCVADKIDKCPDVYGTVRNNGCRDTVKKTVVATTESNNSGSNDTVIVRELPPHIVFNTTTLYFESGKLTMPDSTYARLNEVINVLDKNPKFVLVVSGYTDNVGGDDFNLLLSLKRAESIENYVKGKGIAKKRIIISGNGKKHPLVDNTTEEGRAKNRRIELEVVLPVDR